MKMNLLCAALAALLLLPLASVSGADITPPAVLSVTPAAGSTISNLTQITVLFTEAVTGPEAADLLINGAPANSRTGSSNSWVFTFSQPGPGLVQIAWDGSHAIYDTSGNRFDELAPGSTWSYTLVDTIPPTVLVISPTPGAILPSLTQIEVSFKEPVTGVDASDLLINGFSASGVSGSGEGPYLFSFAQPPSGAVTLTWADGHGITDTAPAHNAFTGGPWSYTL